MLSFSICLYECLGKGRSGAVGKGRFGVVADLRLLQIDPTKKRSIHPLAQKDTK